MARVIITEELEEAINRKFKKQSEDIFELLLTLEENPQKGKPLAQIGGIAIKEIRCGSFRFYFIVDSYAIKFLSIEELTDVIIKFVRMSDKKEQQKTIEEIKELLRKLS